jgi:hypothetical protein
MKIAAGAYTAELFVDVEIRVVMVLLRAALEGRGLRSLPSREWCGRPSW